ncbi:MAG: hypothetical protein H0U76_22915 [Ktedonobacteraceae bacterium]|nr:hypothetical protein [Ktedonobacteraceae bacterium]
MASMITLIIMVFILLIIIKSIRDIRKHSRLKRIGISITASIVDTRHIKGHYRGNDWIPPCYVIIAVGFNPYTQQYQQYQGTVSRPSARLLKRFYKGGVIKVLIDPSRSKQYEILLK